MVVVGDAMCRGDGRMAAHPSTVVAVLGGAVSSDSLRVGCCDCCGGAAQTLSCRTNARTGDAKGGT